MAAGRIAPTKGGIAMKRFGTVAVLLLSACGEVKESKHQQLPDERQLTADEKRKLIAPVMSKMRDPDSLQFKFPPLSKGAHFRFPDDYCFFVNAKNGYGGYDGFALVMAHIKYDSEDNFDVTSVNLHGDFCKPLDHVSIQSQSTNELMKINAKQ